MKARSISANFYRNISVTVNDGGTVLLHFDILFSQNFVNIRADNLLDMLSINIKSLLYIWGRHQNWSSCLWLTYGSNEKLKPHEIGTILK